MYRSFFSKVGRAAYSAAQSQTQKQQYIKRSQNISSSTISSFNIKTNFNTISLKSGFSSLECMNMYSLFHY
jgi:hypothetical protein